MASLKCLDTYALVEITVGNPRFAEYSSEDFVINDLTLTEFYTVQLREMGQQTADYWFNKLRQYSRVVDREILREAVLFRNKHKKKRISFFDAVGYIFAKDNKMVFVTGDKEFEKMPNVEFKKK